MESVDAQKLVGTSLPRWVGTSLTFFSRLKIQSESMINHKFRIFACRPSPDHGMAWSMELGKAGIWILSKISWFGGPWRSRFRNLGIQNLIRHEFRVGILDLGSPDSRLQFGPRLGHSKPRRIKIKRRKEGDIEEDF